MVIRVQAQLEFDPDDPHHQVWFAKVREVLATAPAGAGFDMKQPFTPREVRVEEYIQYLLADKKFHSYNTAGEARRMWGTLVRVCGSQLGVEVPSDKAQAETFPLPLVVLKQLKLVHFEATRSAGKTRERLLKFIEGLH